MHTNTYNRLFSTYYTLSSFLWLLLWNTIIMEHPFYIYTEYPVLLGFQQIYEMEMRGSGYLGDTSNLLSQQR